jgi:multidrug efflux system membrane fusion protein
MTVIEKGIQPHEQVVIDGQMRVVPGSKVEIKPPDKPLAPQSTGPAAQPKPDQQGSAGK